MVPQGELESKPTQEGWRPPRWLVVALMLGMVVTGVMVLRERAAKRLVREAAARRLKTFAQAKAGSGAVLVSDSKLLPMLADDRDCRRQTTRLEFTSITVQAEDAGRVAELSNIDSLSFYCTRGTAAVLKAARELPITEVYFEMPDLEADEYWVLRDYQQLRKVHFEQVMDSTWIEEFRAALPGVEVETPFVRSDQDKLGHLHRG